MTVNDKNLDTQVKNYINFLKKQPKGFVYKDNAEKQEVAQSATTSKQKKEIESKSRQEMLDEIKCKFKNCNKCPLAEQGRAQVVFGVGNPFTKIMFVGEGPGRDEDAQGKPFVGRAGQLLTKIIEAMKLTRDEIYISNVVKCRPPNNRTPLPNESDICKKLILYKEIEIIKPQIICALGATATQGLLGYDANISKSRGIFFKFNDTLVLPTYHPAYLLRNPDAKKIVWEDMKKIMEKLNELNS
jgi:DNA polymerase